MMPELSESEGDSLSAASTPDAHARAMFQPLPATSSDRPRATRARNIGSADPKQEAKCPETLNLVQELISSTKSPRLKSRSSSRTDRILEYGSHVCRLAGTLVVAGIAFILARMLLDLRIEWDS